MNPKQALERAAYNFLLAVTTPLTSIAETSIYRGLNNTVAINDEDNNTQPDSRVLPCVTLLAEGDHSETVFRTKLYRGILAVMVEASAHDIGDDAFATICDEVFSKFDIQELAANMSAVTESFTCIFARIIENGHAIRGDTNWENTIRIECVFAQADL